jgi:hypothetical protein
LPRIERDELEKNLAVDALELDLLILETLQDLVLAFGVELGKGLAIIARSAKAIECGEARFIDRRGAAFRLRSLLARALDEGRPCVEPLLAAVRARELSVDEHRAAGVLSTRCFRIGGNDAIHHRFDGRAFGGCEEEPAARSNFLRRRSGVGAPRNISGNVACVDARRGGKKQCRRRQKVASAEPRYSHVACHRSHAKAGGKFDATLLGAVAR